MKIIFGLGNPGNQYNFTRHNFGFLSLDFYAKINQLEWHAEPKFQALTAKHQNLLLVKPQTFYNQVGESLQNLCHFYKIDPQRDLLVIADDFDLDFGQLRFRQKGSAGGNNGLKSIIKHLNTEKFPRLRLGSNNPPLRNKLGDINFVLSKFTPDEKTQLPQILQNVLKIIENPPK